VPSDQLQVDRENKSVLAGRSPWDFTNPHNPQRDTPGALANNKPYEAWFRDLISHVQHDFNPVAAETQAMTSGGSIPDPTTPWYWKSEVVSGGVVILIASWILWAAGNKLFLYSIVPLHAWKGRRVSEPKRLKVMATAVGMPTDVESPGWPYQRPMPPRHPMPAGSTIP